MADVEVVIKIPKEAKQAFDLCESDDLKNSYYDHGGFIGNAIKNGTLLPENHGRLIDADALIFNADYYEPLISKRDVDFAPTIIEADKGEADGK